MSQLPDGPVDLEERGEFGSLWKGMFSVQIVLKNGGKLQAEMVNLVIHLF